MNRFRMIPERLPGSYVLVVRLGHSCNIRAGSLPPRVFTAGWYAYAGSAMNGLKPRLTRYLNVERKYHWHIDYLLKHGIVAGAMVSAGRNRLECRFAASLAEHLETIAGFGCSDCRCRGHLFYHQDEGYMKTAISSIGVSAWDDRSKAEKPKRKSGEIWKDSPCAANG
jgi:Uri superfamily endonuclease